MDPKIAAITKKCFNAKPGDPADTLSQSEGITVVPKTTSKRGTIVPSSVTGKPVKFERPKCANKVIKSVLTKARVEELPTLEVLLRNKTGVVKKISDVAVFVGSPENEVLAWLAEGIPNKNVINGSAEVDLKNIVNVGVEIVKSGKLYQIPHIADIPDCGDQCTSGRHRLAFLALAYGFDALIPFYSEAMSLNEARDAVVYANDSRTVGAQERAEHAAMQAASGNADISQDDLYAKMCFNRRDSRQYCVFSVINRGYPSKLRFSVSTTAAKGDSLATISSISGFWKVALEWVPGMTRLEFDKNLENSTEFINRLVEYMRTLAGFQADQHMAAMPLVAIGKYYRNMTDVGMAIDQLVIEKLAKVIVGLGPIARVSTDNVYGAIRSGMLKQ
jgi:hypothetical protein